MKLVHKLTAWLSTLAMLMTFMPSFTLGVSAADETSHTHALNYEYSDNEHWQECSDASCPDLEGSKTSAAAHGFDNDCDTDCNDNCGYTRETTHFPIEGWIAGENAHWHDCEFCGEDLDIDGHNYKTELSYDADWHWRECAQCGFSEDLVGHSYDNDTDTTCDCGYTRTINNDDDGSSGTAAHATYTVTATADPTEGGAITGGGTYEENTSVTVIANANDGYEFDGWYENNIYISSNASYTFTATADRELVAKFANLYTVTFNANNGTETTDFNTVADGSSLTLTDDIFTYGKCEIESWNTEADGSGYVYNIDEDITVTEDITLYAQWVLPLNKYDSFSEGDYVWSGNAASPYNFTMKNGAVLYAKVIFPAQSNDDEVFFTVEGNCEIKGSIAFVSGTGMSGSSHRGNLTIKGDGTLKFREMVSTAAGDSLTVETDVTITGDYMFIGASGGMDSKIVIKDAILTLHDLTLLQYLTMEGEAKLNIINGTASFHSNPEITLNDKSEIYIGGDGYGCVLYKENGTNDAFDALVINEWLPAGYSFKLDSNGYTLYDQEDNPETDTITIKKQQYTGGPLGGGGTTRYTVQFDTDGGSKVNSQRFRRNEKVTEPDEPIKNGFTFEGWYTDKAHTTAYDFDTKVTKNFTLYAKWNEALSEDDGKPGTSGHHCPSLKFNDLDITQWYHLDTDYVIEKDIFRGTTETTFTPNGNITRAMMITVLYRADGEPEVTGEATFLDIDENAYYAKAVVWGQQNGIIKGYSETEYAPEQDILREQIAAIMHRYAKYKGYDVSVGENTNILSYDDFDSISEYAIASMQWAVGSGLIKGKSESTLNPKDFATRAEIAAILHRFIEANK